MWKIYFDVCILCLRLTTIFSYNNVLFILSGNTYGGSYLTDLEWRTITFLCVYAQRLHDQWFWCTSRYKRAYVCEVRKFLNQNTKTDIVNDKDTSAMYTVCSKLFVKRLEQCCGCSSLSIGKYEILYAS